MMSAIQTAKQGNKVTLLEKKDSLGRKLLITGKGRCNITSSLPIEDFIANIPGNGRFLYSAFQNYTNQDIISFLKEQGVEVKEERGNRIFPVSDKSMDVLEAFKRELKKQKVNIKTNVEVKEILTKESNEPNVQEAQKSYSISAEKIEKEENLEPHKKENSKDREKLERKQVEGVVLANGQIEKADKIIIATGGKSYPNTGSTGDGYNMAQKLGHTITTLKPSLVPLVAKEESLDLCKEMQGLSLRNVAIKLEDIQKKKIIYEDFGEMLFTHFGVSGPTILSSSAHLLRYPNVEEAMEERKIVLKIDLKPALSQEKLDARIQRDFEKFKNKEIRNGLQELLPQKMILPILKLTQISETKQVNSIKKEERAKLVKIIKEFPITISKFRPIEEAIITAGGVSIKQVNPKTMESKLVNGLYFAGEILDVDAYTGGFNLQIAYSTGYVAGSN